jgi:hypothetical protein
MTLLNQTTPDMVFHYTTNWREGKVCQMWIEEVGKNLYVAVAYNPEEDKSMTMSNPRGYFDTLDWVRGWCGSFSIVPTYC